MVARKAEVLITGATGFVGKSVLVELLSRRKALGIERISVLVRGKGKLDPRARLEALGRTAVFAALPEGWTASVQVIPGDVTQPELGLSLADRTRLRTRITHVIHLAASIRFDLPLAEAAAMNVEAALRVLEFSRTCTRIERHTHCSTAYVHPPGRGPHEEVLVPLARGAEPLWRDIRTHAIEDAVLLAETGYPNSYTLTKALAEHVIVGHAGDLPLSIVRPSIVSASWRKPFPGWLDSFAAFAGVAAPIATGHLHVLPCNPAVRLDVVPVDVVAEQLVHATFETHEPLVIRQAVAGLERSVPVGESPHLAVDFFRPYRPNTRRPAIVRLAPDAPLQRALHFGLDVLPIHVASVGALLRGDVRTARRMRRLAGSLGELVRTFRTFTHHEWDFRSSRPLDAPEFDARAYVDTIFRGLHEHLLRRDTRSVPLVGRETRGGGSAGLTLSPAICSPQQRLLAAATRRVIARITEDVGFDADAFRRARLAIPPDHHPVFVPVSRSHVDPLLCAALLEAHPELGGGAPDLTASAPVSSALARVLLGWAGRLAIAEAGRVVPAIEASLDRGHPLQLVLDRVASHRALRALQRTGRSFALVPVGVTYDRMPEDALADPGLLALVRGVVNRTIDLGRVHLGAGRIVLLRPEHDAVAVAAAVLGEQHRATACTTHHLRAFGRSSGFDPAWLRREIERRGGHVLESRFDPGPLSPAGERRLRHHWIHHFHPEARVRLSQHPRAAERLETYAHTAPHGLDAHAEAERPDVRALLEALFMPEPTGREPARRRLPASFGDAARRYA